MLESSVPSDYLEVGGTESISAREANQDDLYKDAAAKFGSSLERLASAYEADPEKRRDLSQDIHFQLWRSFGRYDARCSVRTWVYRVAHHVAASHVLRERRILDRQVIVSYLEDLDAVSIGEITGLSPGNVAMRIHRIKNILTRRFHEGGSSHAE